MMIKRLCGVCAGALLALAATGIATAQDGKLYRWVDEDGVTHFGDRLPPEYADEEHELLNDYGVAVNSVEAAKTADELAAEEQAAEAAEMERQRAEAQQSQDRILLNTYISVDEIEALRDRRMELVSGQIRVTEIYLEDLREKLGRLQTEAENFRPYSSDANARPIPDNLAREMSETLDSIILYEKTLHESRNRQQELMTKFEADIGRFKELKDLD